MTCKREQRARHNTIAFWLSDEEKGIVEARIILSGLSKGEYYRSAVLGQKINVVAGKYMSERIAIALEKMNCLIEKECIDEYELKELLEQLLTIWNNKKISD